GRRPVYLFGLLCVGSLGVGTATRVPELMFWRLIQAFGSSGGMSGGGGVIADLYKLTERGTAMGIFLAAALLGNALAPVIGGWVAHYASWRYLQLALLAFGGLLTVAMALYLPETSHPGTTGLEKLASAERSKADAVGGAETDSDSVDEPDNERARFRWVTFSSAAALVTEFGLQVPMATTIGVRYGITNEALIGACFIPMGLGNILGAPLAGWLSDRADRLRGSSALGAGLLVPLSILASGAITTWVPGTVDLVLSPGSSYSVDVVMAASAGVRSMFLAAVVAGILPSIERYGVLGTDAIAAGIAWAGAIWLVIQYGDRMRAWLDIGYSTQENN
ncbi:MFS general substrate transporter, partial [Mycena olivaceomarginata]